MKKSLLSWIAVSVICSLSGGAFAAGEINSTRVVVPTIQADAPAVQRDATEINRDRSTLGAACGEAHKGYVTADPPGSEACSIGSKTSVDSTAADGTFNWTCTRSGNSTSVSCLAYYGSGGGGGGDPPDVTGVCGAADGASAASYPTTGLCSTGTATTVDNVGNDGAYNWTCAGSGTGTDASCSAPHPLSGTCGTANGVASSTYPSSGLCGSGSATSVDSSGSDGTFNWTCGGSGGGSNASCSAPKSTNGVCGTANNTSRTSYPGGAQACSTGLQGDVDTTASDGTFNWTCAASGSGTPATCSATRPVNGTCGAANGSDLASYPSGSAACVNGSQATIDNTGSDGSFNWTCNGSGGGTNATCAANRAPVNSTYCGTAAGVATTTYPTANHCSQGTKADVDTAGTDGSYNWTCKPVFQTAGACSAPRITNGTCGSANGTNSATYPTSTSACSAGTQALIDDQGDDGSYNWSCLGRNGGTSPNCSATKPVNGSCGTASGAGQFVTTYPASNQCAAGTHTPVDSNGNDGQFNWNCTGSGGGTTAACLASKAFNGTCGSAAGGTYTSYPGAGKCQSGTASDIDTTGSDGTFNWTCVGSTNGSDQACSAIAQRVNGTCGTANGTSRATYPTGATACTAGSQVTLDNGGSDGSWNWRCDGSAGGSNATCSASNPITGTCGSANGGSSTSYPSSGLCNAGTASATDSTGSDGSYNWTCQGVSGGGNASCSSTRLISVTGSCGTARNTMTPTYPSSNLCAAGTEVAVDTSADDQTYNWTCQGSNGGGNASCSAPAGCLGRNFGIAWGNYATPDGEPNGSPDGKYYSCSASQDAPDTAPGGTFTLTDSIYDGPCTNVLWPGRPMTCANGEFPLTCRKQSSGNFAWSTGTFWCGAYTYTP